MYFRDKNAMSFGIRTKIREMACFSLIKGNFKSKKEFQKKFRLYLRAKGPSEGHRLDPLLFSKHIQKD